MIRNSTISERLRRLRGEPANETLVWRELDLSLFGRVLNWLIFRSKARDAFVVRQASAAARGWQAVTPVRRVRLVSYGILAAVTTHTLMLMLVDRPAGAWWLIFPALASLFAVLLLIGTRSDE